MVAARAFFLQSACCYRALPPIPAGEMTGCRGHTSWDPGGGNGTLALDARASAMFVKVKAGKLDSEGTIPDQRRLIMARKQSGDGPAFLGYQYPERKLASVGIADSRWHANV